MSIKFKLVSIEHDNLPLHGLLLNQENAGGTAINVHGTWGNFYLNPFVVPTAELYSRRRLNFLTANFPGHDETAVHERFEDFTEALDRWLDSYSPTGSLLLQGFSLGALKVLYYMNDPRARHRSRVTRIVLLSPYDNVAFYSGNNEAKIREVSRLSQEQNRQVNVPDHVFNRWPISAGTFLEMTRSGNPSDLFPSRLDLVGSPLLEISIPTLVAIGAEDFASYPNPANVYQMVKNIKNDKVVPVLIDGAPHTFADRINTLVDEIGEWSTLY